MNENFKGQNQQNQANNQQIDQAIIEAAEAKTVLNGKVVSINQAQAAQEAFEAANTKTGIQAHHSNQSEAVQAGQKAQGQTTAATTSEAAKQAEMKIKQANVQSGQAHLEQHINQGAQSENEKLQQEAQESFKASQTQASQPAQTKAKGSTKAAE